MPTQLTPAPECPRCLFTSEYAHIGLNGQCNYCDLHDTLESQADPNELPAVLDDIRRKGRRKQYDCLMGISGGLDSTTLLYAAVRLWGLRPLVIHFDNGWNAAAAESNMKQITELLGVPVIVYKPNKIEYDRLNLAFLLAGTLDMDIPNDIAMTKLMYDTAHKYGIKWILNGHDFRTEGSTPAKWTYMDARYIRDVYRRHSGGELVNYPLFTFKDQLLSAWRGIRQVRPFHYIDPQERTRIEGMMKSEIMWKNYGGKHCENVYTEFIGSYVLPEKFGIDKRIVYLSARVRSGLISKQEARLELSKPAGFDLRKMDKIYLNAAHRNNKRDRMEYDRYNFKRYRILIWLLAKMKVVPETFYRKYAT